MVRWKENSDGGCGGILWWWYYAKNVQHMSHLMRSCDISISAGGSTLYDFCVCGMLSIILFLGGVQLLGIGGLGQYMAKMFLEVKKRPMYIIRESSNGGNDE